MKTKKGYKKIAEKIDTIDTKICEIRDSLGDLKDSFSTKKPPVTILEDEDTEPEICPDEIEADMAVYEVIRDICLESMLDLEPVGEA
tara:strand:- start:720 stop:980 length:261 start_codon:yes stop_codon:yes gene_type:complete